MKKRYPPTIIVPRDYEIIRLCATLGGVESFDISTLLFTPAPVSDDGEVRLQTQANCQKRLRLLYKRGFLERIEQPSRRSDGTKYNIHIPTKDGIHALAEYLGKPEQEIYWRKIDPKASNQFLSHLMWINAVRVAFMYSVPRYSPDSEIDLWIDDAQLKRTHSQRDYRMTWKWPNGKIEKNAANIPDSYSYIRLAVMDEIIGASFDHYYSLFEIDKDTETTISNIYGRHTWQRKILLYLEMFKPGGIYERYYQEERLGRVFTITTSLRRLMSLKEATEKAGGRDRFLFTTMQAIEDEMQKSLLAEAKALKAQREAKATGALLPPPVIPTFLTEPIWHMAGSEELHTFVL